MRLRRATVNRFIFALIFMLISYAVVHLAPAETQQTKETLGDAISPTSTTSPIPTIRETQLNDVPPGSPAIVTHVVDGDTITVQINSAKEKVRLIGVNTPETVDPRRPVQCYGKEASAYTKSLLTDKTVYLEADESQSDRDKYNRLLRYVWLDAQTNVNKQFVAEGYAYEYTYNLPYKYQAEFKAAEKEAKDAGKGLWAEDACNGRK